MAAWDLHATVDGWVLKFGRGVVAEFRNFKDASAGYRLARRALLMLDATLAAKPHTKEV